MAQKPTRDIFRIIINNFLNSFKKIPKAGNLMGEDYFGNKYYEIPANPAEGKPKPSRWFEPLKKDDFDQELTAEWEAWLRGRRADPPTREELVQNLQIMRIKERNAMKLDEKFGKDKDKVKSTLGKFPKYDDFEINPHQDTKKDSIK